MIIKFLSMSNKIKEKEKLNRQRCKRKGLKWSETNVTRTNGSILFWLEDLCNKAGRHMCMCICLYGDIYKHIYRCTLHVHVWWQSKQNRDLLFYSCYKPTCALYCWFERFVKSRLTQKVQVIRRWMRDRPCGCLCLLTGSWSEMTD